MTLESIEVQTGPQPGASLIVLHGLGDSGHGWTSICEELDLSPIGDVRFVLPHADERPVTINNGYRMRAWYDIAGPGRPEDDAGLRASQKQVEALIAREKQRGVPASRIVLMGFSQGCAMTLMTGLRQPERLAGLVALSGYLPLADKLAAERHMMNADIPIFMAHGRQDPVIPLARATWSRDELKKLGYAIEWHEYDMQHSASIEEIGDLNRWLLKVLA